MKNFDLNKTWFGLLAGLFAPFVVFWIYYLINYNQLTFFRFLIFLKQGEMQGALISMCVLVNLAIFYPYIWKEKWNGAKGVLGATFIWAGVVVYIKFFA